jgi:predicted nucleic acid-binding protein
VRIEYFLDASYAIALASPKDENHGRAVELARHIRTERILLVTTQPVVLEIGNALAKPRYRASAVKLLEALQQDRTVEIVSLNDNLFQQGYDLYRRHMDKSWGLTDCVSFVVMRHRGLSLALIADDHFRQAGFVPLLQAE